MRALDVPAAAAEHDLFLWTQTYPLAEAGGTIGERQAMLEGLRSAGIPSAGFHLDRWWGLDRETQIEREPFFKVDVLFTADGGHDDRWAEHDITHVWSPPAVYHAECEPVEALPRYASDLAFVGSWRGAYHPEWKHRHALINHLRRRYGRRAVMWPRVAGQPVRGKALAHLYASVKILIGDSCLVGAPSRYFSDRIPETLGRGGFLLHPYVEGIDHLYTDGKHLRFWPLGDWDELDRLVAYYLEHEDERREIAAEGRRHVLEFHTYRHRMQTMLDYMNEQNLIQRGWHGEIRAGSPDAVTLSEIYEQDVYRARGHIQPESLVVDLGANVGIFSIWAARQGASVIALEPVPQNVEQFTRNVQAHNMGARISLRPRAVGATTGWARTMPRDLGPENSVEAWVEPCEEGDDGAVRVVSLDSLFAGITGNVAVLKLDVEGSEYEVIEGASLETLRRVQFIAIEFHGGPMRHRPVESDAFGAMVTKLCEVFSLEIIGLPSNGGYIYGRRHSD